LKGKTTSWLILVIVLSLSVPSAFSENDIISVDYIFQPFTVENQWVIEDTHILEITGEPLIPYRAAKILLPEGMVLKDITVISGTPFVQKGFELPSGQSPCILNDALVKKGRNEETYQSDDLYPDKLFEVTGVEYFRGFGILNIHLFPFQYRPKSGTVKFYPKLTVEVRTSKGTKNKLYRGIKVDKEAVSKIVDNPEVVKTYSDGKTPLATEEYIVITNGEMQSTFQQLADWKANFVNGAGAYDVTYIYNNYTGSDNPEKIRNFIIDKYTNNGTLYVLLGGDIAAVPYRGFYVYSGGYTDSDMAADMYFAHLDGTFNDDGDSYWAEPGEVDWYAEVAVGRAPVETLTEAQNFVNKVIAYEQMDKPKRIVLHQSRMQTGNSPDSRCLAWNCDDWIPGDYIIDYLFEEDGTITKAKWRDAWASGPLLVVHIGHGNTDVYYINYEIGGTVSWYSSDISSLTNTFWPVHMSVADNCGDFCVNDCLGEEYVKRCKAIAFIGNVNYGWLSTSNACMYSGEFIEMFIRALFHDGKEKLGDMLNGGKSYLVSSAQSNSTYRWCFYEINLIGDPETPILTKRNGLTVSCTVSIEAECSGADTVEFYVDGKLKYTDTTEPFIYDWNTCPYPDGNHTILIKGYASGVLMCEDTRTYTVSHYYVKIIEPQDRETVSGVVPITIDANCVDTVKLYIDGELKYTKIISDPPRGEIIQYEWDTTQYTEGTHTIEVEGYENTILRRTVFIQVTVDNIIEPYVAITNPAAGQTVSGTVTCAADSNCDSIHWYIDDSFVAEDNKAPFQYVWDTTQYSNGPHTVGAEGYISGVLSAQDEIPCTVDNKSCEGTVLTFLIVLVGSVVITAKKN
jgi:hypothetical protein